MKRILLYLNNISIRKRFILVYILGICLPVIVGAIVWWAFTSHEIRQNTTYHLDQTFEETAGNFQMMIQIAVNISNQVNADTSIRDDLSRNFSTPVEHYELYWDHLRNRFEMYLVSNPDIASITLYIDDPHFINTDYFRVLDDDVRKTEWYKAASESDSNIVIYPGPTAISIIQYPNRLTVIRRVQSPDYLNNAVNYLLIEIKMDRIIAGLSRENLTMDTYLTYSGNMIFWGTRYPEARGEPPVLTLPPENKYYILRKDIGSDRYFEGWSIYGIYDKNQIYRRQFVVLIYILLITLSLAGFSVFLIWSVLNSMRYRLSALSDHMKKVTEDHFEPLVLPDPGKDEIGWLINSFNKMIADINKLINVVFKLEMQKKSAEVENIRAQYKYLQAQVDPHFLFNTLNAILVFCVKNNYTELSSVISSLSKLLKRLLTTGNDLITVSEEFDFIDKYLAIEKFRFGGKFQYEIHISSEVIESKPLIPKMSIQPIVENACKHGLQSSMDENRKLVLKADIIDGSLIISVKDNGTGMNKEQVKTILNNVYNPEANVGTQEENSAGVGIQNVYRRMVMNYHHRFHFSINSAPGCGTEIILCVDKEESPANLADM